MNDARGIEIVEGYQVAFADKHEYERAHWSTMSWGVVVGLTPKMVKVFGVNGNTVKAPHNLLVVQFPHKVVGK